MLAYRGKQRSPVTTQLHAQPAPPVPEPPPARTGNRGAAFPVVGLGASAGGLDPLTAFFSQVPADSGIAYVVVQHLDPDHKALLSELLQRAARVPVAEITDRMVVLPDHAYVIPPDADLVIEHGMFRLSKPVDARGHRLPIDRFFCSLAAERNALAVGVVLSGMGADGTRGLRAIRDRDGITLAQRPDTARFDPMPANAIGADVVDAVELAENMPGSIMRALAASGVLRARGEGRERHQMRQIHALLRERTGSSFSDYKSNTMTRRIERRISLQQLDSLGDYLGFLRDNPAEVDLLFKELLIGVTQFFRDADAWEFLSRTALPQMLAAHPEGRAFKAWVAACSTGEEAYSLAMAFCELVAGPDAPAGHSLQIFATDLSADAIAKARLGRFPRAIEADVSPARLERFFVPDGDGYRVKRDLRNMIVFAQQNIISDPPFTKLDLLCCRNLLIYLNSRLQQRLIPLFHYALNRGGVLVLGNADTPGNFSDLFAPLTTLGRIFRRQDSAARQPAFSYFPTKTTSSGHLLFNESKAVNLVGNIQSLVEQQLLQHYSPAAVLINPDGDILYIHGRTGAYLEPAAGKANWNLHAMAREGLRHELSGLIKAARDSHEAVRRRGLIVTDAAGQALAVDLSADALRGVAGLQGMLLITFAGAALPPEKRPGRAPSPKVLELERQLAQARREMLAIREEMQNSSEELRSANEELHSTNEELQSTNEELTTSKEEMQSLNEELYTVNAELQSKVDDLSLVNSDMKNLLNSTDIATIFLDGGLRIRRFTTQASQIYKLIQSDLHRPLTDIANDLEYQDLEADAQEVLRTLVFSEKQVRTRDGRWFTVRVMPYRTLENVIDGVVVTFINISESKRLEAQLRQLQVGGGVEAP